MLHAFAKGYKGYKSNFGFRVPFDRESRQKAKIRFCICRKKHTHNFLKVSEANFKVPYDVAQRLSERRSLEVDLLRLNGFGSYYKFTWEKNDCQMLCQERREISLTLLLVNCHDLTSSIFD